MTHEPVDQYTGPCARCSAPRDGVNRLCATCRELWKPIAESLKRASGEAIVDAWARFRKTKP